MPKDCLKCGAENVDEYVFCSKCGSRLDGNEECGNCKNLVAEGTVFCPFCGKRMDGKIKCNSCGEFISKGVFCPVCGIKQNDSALPNNDLGGNYNGNFVPVKTSQVPIVPMTMSNVKDTKVYNICKLALLTFLSLILFISSFFTVTSMEMNLPELENQKKINVEISSIQYIEALFFINQERTLEEVLVEFMEFAQDSIYTESVTPAQVGRILSRFNVLKILTASENLSLSPHKSVEVVFAGIFMLLFILFTGAMLIVNVVRLILYLIDGKRFGNKLSIFNFAIPLVFSVVMHIFIKSSFFAQAAVSTPIYGVVMGATFITTIVFCLLALIVLGLDKFVFNETDITVGTLVSRGVGFVLASVMAVIASGAIINTQMIYTNDYNLKVTVNVENNAFEFYNANDIYYNTETSNQTDYKNCINNLVENLKNMPNKNIRNMMAAIVIPMGLLSLKETVEGFASVRIMMIFVPIVYSIMLLSIALLMGGCLLDIFLKKRKLSSIFHILSLVLFIALLVLTIIVCVSYIPIFELNSVAQLSMGLGSGIIACGILGIINIIQHFVVSGLVKIPLKKSKKMQVENAVLTENLI